MRCSAPTTSAPACATSSASRSATSLACTRCCSTIRWLKDTGVTTLDFAKAMIDEGYHPMTMYFPLVVHGAMLIEPTEVGIEGVPRPVHRRAARSREIGEVRRCRALQAGTTAGAAPPPRRDQGRPRAQAHLEAGSGAQSGGRIGAGDVCSRRRRAAPARAHCRHAKHLSGDHGGGARRKLASPAVV